MFVLSIVSGGTSFFGREYAGIKGRTRSFAAFVIKGFGLSDLDTILYNALSGFIWLPSYVM